MNITKARAALFLLLSVGAFLYISPARGANMSSDMINQARYSDKSPEPGVQSPLAAKLQILLDRQGMSPGAIDGVMGENVRKAISAFREAKGISGGNGLTHDVWSALGGDNSDPVIVEHELTDEELHYPYSDAAPEDYAVMAKMKRLNYTSPEEMLAEEFHMSVDLLKQLNRGRDLSKGGKVLVAAVGDPIKGSAGRIEADKRKAQLRVYDRGGRPLVAYPATIGSKDMPSPSGTHKVDEVVTNPSYTYDPEKNFQQGDNTEKLEIQPGPNNPVGTVWIGLSEPTYGIHGTPEPEQIDKTASHGCVRLTNWDAEELAKLVKPGVEVKFVD